MRYSIARAFPPARASARAGIAAPVRRAALAFAFALLPLIALAQDFTEEERAWLRAHPTVSFVSQEEYPPFEFLGEDGRSSGMCPDLVRWMGERHGFEPVFSNTTFLRAQERVLDGTADVLTSFFYSPARDERFDFTSAMFDVPALIFVRDGEDRIRGVDDLRGMRIAMQEGDYAREFLEGLGIEYDRVSTQSFASAAEVVISGGADALVGDEQIVLYHLREAGEDHLLKTVGEPLYTGRNCMGVREDADVLASILTKSIEQARREGVLDDLRRRWLGPAPAHRHTWVQDHGVELAAAAGLLLLAAGLVIAWNGQLKRRVRERTRDAEESRARLAEANRALRAGERRLALALSGSRLAFWDYDVASDDLKVDEAWLRMLGYGPGEIATDVESVLSRRHPDDREAIRAALAAHLAGETELYVAEFRFQRKDGGWLWIQSIGSVTERDDLGRPARMNGVYQDVTERRRQERERVELDARMQEVARLESLSVLAGGIAHDFNNLLVGILGSAGIALSELPGESPARESLLLIERTARQAADLTRQMLAYSGKGRFVVAPVNLARLVRETTHLLETVVSPKATLRLDLDDSVPAVEADATQMRQILMNLILNASDALEEKGGIVTIRAGVMDADRAYLDGTRFGEEREPGRYVFLEVSDTGVGMTEEVLARVFEPFFTTKKRGHGLGLAAVLGIIRGHRGFLKVYSEPGRGSTFKAGLPATSAKADSTPRNDSERAALRAHGTVLVVDDQETVRTVAGRMMRKLGFEVVEAGGGREGLALFERHRDKLVLVLVDMSMPDLAGDEVFGAIRRIDEDIPVVLMSGFNEQDATSRFVGKGLAGFLQKPFTVADMRRTVDAALAEGAE